MSATALQPAPSDMAGTTRLDPPPPDVVAAVSAAIKACQDWPIVSSGTEAVRLATDPLPPPLSAEASICAAIKRGPDHIYDVAYAGGSIGIAVGLIAALVFVVARGLVRDLAGTRLGRKLGPASLEPEAISLGGALPGAFLGACVSFTAGGVLFGTLVGAAAWIYARKVQQRWRAARLWP